MSPEFNDNMTLSNKVFFWLTLQLWVYMPLIVTLEEPVNSKYNSIMKICVKKTIITQKVWGVFPSLFCSRKKLKYQFKKKNAIARIYDDLRPFLWWSWFDNNSKWKANSLNMQLSFTTTSEWLIMLKLYIHNNA